MRLAILALLMAGCFGGWSRFSPDAADGFTLVTASFDGAPRRLWAYVPRAVPPATGWPLIVFLHGGGESGERPLLPTQVGLGPEIYTTHGKFPFVVLFPQCPRPSSWTSPRMEAHVIAAIDQAIATLHVDPHRVYLVGNSMGGHGALHLAARHADRFAAMVSVAGRAGPSRWFPAPPDSAETLPREGAEDVLADTLAAVPTWLFHGGDDSITEAEASIKMAAALRERGDEVRLTIYPDVGHAGAWERAWADPALFAWLLQHRRP